jgi:hypothetical protein
MEYPTIHFLIYSLEVMKEIEKHGYKISSGLSKNNFQRNYEKLKNDNKCGGALFFN